MVISFTYTLNNDDATSLVVSYLLLLNKNMKLDYLPRLCSFLLVSVGEKEKGIFCDDGVTVFLF